MQSATEKRYRRTPKRHNSFVWGPNLLENPASQSFVDMSKNKTYPNITYPWIFIYLVYFYGTTPQSAIVQILAHSSVAKISEISRITLSSLESDSFIFIL